MAVAGGMSMEGLSSALCGALGIFLAKSTFSVWLVPWLGYPFSHSVSYKIATSPKSNPVVVNLRGNFFISNYGILFSLGIWVVSLSHCTQL